MSNEDVARAFSGHRFTETFAQLAPDVQWILVGAGRIEGAEAVMQACRDSAAEATGVSTTWLRFISTGIGDVVAVDAIGRYEGGDDLSVVSSCDIYEFTGGKITTITSYAVDVDPGDVGVARARSAGPAEADTGSG